MHLIVLGVLSAIGVLVGFAVWRLRHGDRSVIERMRSSDREDGSRDPRAYTPHSHI